jgi:undecaprenyl-diphosphatase
VDLDWNLFLAINQFAGRSSILDAAGKFSAEYAAVFFALLPIALWFLPAATERRRAREQRVANAVIALAGAWLTVHAIGAFFYRARPFIAHSVTQLIAHAPDSSFPSDHTTFAFTLIIALSPVLGRTRWFWVALGALIGLARVFVGVHYPSDVLGGAALGVIWGALALVIAPLLARIELPVLDRLAQWRLA